MSSPEALQAAFASADAGESRSAVADSVSLHGTLACRVSPARTPTASRFSAVLTAHRSQITTA